MKPGTSVAASRSSHRFAPISGISPDCAWITGDAEVTELLPTRRPFGSSQAASENLVVAALSLVPNTETLELCVLSVTSEPRTDRAILWILTDHCGSPARRSKSA
jgi:hypothetical protein